MAPSPSSLSPGPTAWSRLARALETAEAAMQDSARRIASDGDGEAIHDLRVAIRRARTTLSAGQNVLGGKKKVRPIRKALAQVMRKSNEARDEEVFTSLLRDAGEDGKNLADTRRAHLVRLREGVERSATSTKLLKARLRLRSILSSPPSDATPFTEFWGATMERSLHRVTTSWSTNVGDPAAMHALRIALKKLRYTLEFAPDSDLPRAHAAAFGTLARGSKRLQDQLGKLHDLDQASEILLSGKKKTAEVRARVLTQLTAKRERLAAALRRELAVFLQQIRDLEPAVVLAFPPHAGHPANSSRASRAD